MVLDFVFGNSGSDSLGNVRYRRGCCLSLKPSPWASLPAEALDRKSDKDKIELLRLIRQEGERDMSLLCFDEIDDVVFGVLAGVAVVPVLCLGRLKMEVRDDGIFGGSDGVQLNWLLYGAVCGGSMSGRDVSCKR